MSNETVFLKRREKRSEASALSSTNKTLFVLLWILRQVELALDQDAQPQTAGKQGR